VTDFSQALASWLEPLAKKQDPEHFRLVRGAIDDGGRDFVNYQGQIKHYLPGMENKMRRYREQVLHNHGTIRPARSSQLKGVTRKLVYNASAAPLLKEDAAHYMVKPYHERVVQRARSWMHYPIQGWAEMANQGLYHAGGIGHLHQQVHIEEHDMGEGHEREPALVVHMTPGFKPVANADLEDTMTQHPEMVNDARKIAWMDFLTNNLDRHGGNLLVHPDGKLLAINHSRSFQYKATKKHGFGPTERYAPLRDMPQNYVFSDAIRKMKQYIRPDSPMRSSTQEYGDSEHWEPTAEWWGTVSSKVRARMAQELKHIKSDIVRKHIQRNFNARAHLLDQYVKFGVGNHGRYEWARQETPMYRPNEKAEGEV